MKKFFIFFLIFFSFSSSLFGQEVLKIGTIERPPMAFKNQDGSWSGFSIDLLKEISKIVGFDYKIKEYKLFPKMIKDTEEKKVDLSIANITISSEREKKLDFSQPIYDSGLQIVVLEKGNKTPLWKIILESGILWFILGALLLLLLIAHILWFFERGVENKRHDYFRDDYFGGVWDAFWWAFIIMTMGGFENEVPARWFSRFLAMFWIVVSLFFISTLTAKITSSMTLSQLSSNISSYKDLNGKNVGIMDSPPIYNYLSENISANIIKFKQYKNLYSALKKKKVDAIVADEPIVSYFVSKNPQMGFKKVGPIFKAEKYGIAFPEGSPLKEKIDYALVKLQEEGKYRQLYDKYFKK